ncbi:MAG TPA: pantoate--beta-alanine ligase [Verrucomicrobiales bacterium]|nr:pantoate--beta-alanine ligase [Verrucomicrobiales bacterium]
MRIVASLNAMQRLALRWKRAGTRVALVPTMGYLHEGHASLIRRARREAGPRGKVVVSLYVNPTQFAPTEDLSRYPRDFLRDRALCRRMGADALFFPSDAEMYPGRDQGRYSTYVVEEALTRPMEGASRPTHFRGVTTVVAKLFNLILPDISIFGAKDWQQAAVLRRMAADLNFHGRIVVSPTIRERDGLAMSSRNAYLTPAQRKQAICLWNAIREARRIIRSRGRSVPCSSLVRTLSRGIELNPEAKIDYLAFFDPETLVPATRVGVGTHFALAVRVGTTRLIDNARI